MIPLPCFAQAKFATEIKFNLFWRTEVILPEGKRPLGRPMLKLEDNIKIDLQEVGWGMDWIDLAQDRG